MLKTALELMTASILIGKALERPTEDVLGAVISHWEAWHSANISTEQFLEENKEDLDRIAFGATFTREQLEAGPWNLSRDEIKQVYRHIVQDLMIRRNRLGVRWTRVRRSDEHGIRSIGSYEDEWDFSHQYGLEVTLAAGAIKVPDHPDYHVSDSLSEYFPPTGGTINASMELSKLSIEHLQELLEFMKTNYGRVIKVVQIDNEPKYKTGDKQWVFTIAIWRKRSRLQINNFQMLKYL